MILDSIDLADLYAGLHPAFAAGFAWLRAFDAATPDGRHDIDGERHFALVQTVPTAPAAEKQFEAHRRYIDIQYVVSGDEIMLHAPLAGLREIAPFDPTRDVGFFHDPSSATALRVPPGSFAVFFPHDAHKPCCCPSSPGTVRKIVLKIEV
ncbi:YhcH/YjgK/YiaL family protein [Opitutales bacterium ASA1]|uniref:YhcH/YjgK/YiaL family protein n=1 Tax=Congregicoccus parvus TaxID=3081749 RepID=UPI002B30E8B4|nr:YhcH/YjgK/YiaL family protein [Opitutales bacterium ASA1]